MKIQLMISTNLYKFHINSLHTMHYNIIYTIVIEQILKNAFKYT